MPELSLVYASSLSVCMYCTLLFVCLLSQCLMTLHDALEAMTAWPGRAVMVLICDGMRDWNAHGLGWVL